MSLSKTGCFRSQFSSSTLDQSKRITALPTVVLPLVTRKPGSGLVRPGPDADQQTLQKPIVSAKNFSYLLEPPKPYVLSRCGSSGASEAPHSAACVAEQASVTGTTPGVLSTSESTAPVVIPVAPARKALFVVQPVTTIRTVPVSSRASARNRPAADLLFKLLPLPAFSWPSLPKKAVCRPCLSEPAVAKPSDEDWQEDSPRSTITYSDMPELIRFDTWQVARPPNSMLFRPPMPFESRASKMSLISPSPFAGRAPPAPLVRQVKDLSLPPINFLSTVKAFSVSPPTFSSNPTSCTDPRLTRAFEHSVRC